MTDLQTGHQGKPGWKFEREAIRAFRFVRHHFDPESGIATLAYAFDDGPELVETVAIPGAPFALDAGRADAVARALRLLHLIAGVSYYKAAVPPDIVVEGEPLDDALAALLHAVYRNGLGEFAYRNGIALDGRIRFPSSGVAPAAAPDAAVDPRRAASPPAPGSRSSPPSPGCGRSAHRAC
jgi:hypothetical protein